MTMIPSAALAALCLASAPCVVLAQPSAPQPSGGTGGDKTTADNKVEEVVVTAQRRSENLQNVPISVTALSSDRLKAASVQSTAGLASITPSLTFYSGLSNLAPRIRGIGSSSSGAGVENSVAFYVDGVYIASASAALFDLNNVDRVEILNGPQGTLFGRNATGGLVQIITKTPSAQASGSADIAISNYTTIGGDLYVTGPVAKNITADLALTLNHQGDGYGKNLTSGEDIYRTDREISARSSFLFQDEALKIRLAMDFQQIISSDPTVTELSGTAPAATHMIQQYGPWDGEFNSEPLHKLLSGGVGLTVDRTFGNVTAESITAYRKSSLNQTVDADFSPAPGTIENYIDIDEQYSEEIRLISDNTSRLKWTVGLYYFHLDTQLAPFELISGPPTAERKTLINDSPKTDSEAGFVQATYAVWPDTNVTAGFRYTGEQKSLSGAVTSVTTAGAATTTVFPTGHLSYGSPTWRLSVDHEFQDDLMAYISYNRGFKSGGYSATSPSAPAYLPETLDAYEIGLKETAFDRRLRLNTALFYYDYSNIQVNTYIGSVPLIYNGARAAVYGADIDFAYRILGGLGLTGGATLLHDRFISFPAASIATPNGNGTVSISKGSATGNRLPFAPDANATLGLDYKFYLPSGSVNLAVNDLYSTGYFAQADNYLHQAAYNMLGGSITWKSRAGNYSVKIFANNILNAPVAELMGASASSQIVSYEPPRTFGVRIGTTF